METKYYVVARIDGDAYVYVREGADWAPRRVEVGLDNNRMIRILKGLKPGETVMTAPPVKEDKEEESSKADKSDG